MEGRTPRVVRIISDVHLGALPRDGENSFVRWLEDVGSRTDQLLINGDLFDYWFEYRSVIPRGYTRVLGLLGRLVDSGVRIGMTGGNHDWWGGDFLREEIGIDFWQDPVRIEVAGRTLLLAHGDGLGPGDGGYRALRRVLRHPWIVGAFGALHPDLGGRIARRVSRTEGKVAPYGPDSPRAVALRDWALGELDRDRSLDWIALGHSHVPECLPAGGGRFYLNSGDWLHHRSFLTLHPGEDPLLEWWERAPADGVRTGPPESAPREG